MDDNQKLSLFRAIAISTASSPVLIPLVNAQSRADAFETLEQFKKFDGRVAVILELLQTEALVLPVASNNIDITASAKLYTLGVLQSFLKTNYGKLNNESDRLAIRNAVLTAARQLLAKCSSSSQLASDGQSYQDQSAIAIANSNAVENEHRFLAIKIASLIADIATRDFPQRWTSFISDLFSPPDKGGLWYIPPSTSSYRGYGPLIGVKLCLECLKIITEDCTDGDFNSKISTSRRNDVLVGLNEVNQQFLPLIFEVLSSQYAIINASKTALNEMINFLVSNSRTIYQMTPQEKPMYDSEIRKRDNAGKIVADCLIALKQFCESMPTDWIFNNYKNCDFISALLHLLREETADLQTLAVACLQQIVLRKIDFHQWLRLVSALPSAISDANDASSKQDGIKAASEGRALDPVQVLVDKFPFHRGLSKMLACTISAHIAHITNDKDIIRDRGLNYQVVSTFLGLLADMLSHPSPRICGEQNNTWNVLLRDHYLVLIERLDLNHHGLTHLVEEKWNERHEHSSGDMTEV